MPVANRRREMRKLLVVILIAITFSSCEYFLGGGITVEPKVYMVAIGIGYEHSADISIPSTPSYVI